MTRIYYKKTSTWYPSELPMDRFIICNRDPRLLTPPFIKDFKISIPRFKLQEFSYSDIDTIFIGTRLDYMAAKLAIEKILLEAGMKIAEINKISIRKSERAYQ